MLLEKKTLEELEAMLATAIKLGEEADRRSVRLRRAAETALLALEDHKPKRAWQVLADALEGR
jgi:hypothetical protein